MKFDRRISAMWKTACREETRYTLRGIQIDVEKKIAVVTDGHALAVLGIADLIEPEDVTFLIPVDALKAATALYSQQKRLMAKERKAVTIRLADGAVVVALGKSKRSQSFDAVVGSYPAWEKVAPDFKGYKLTINLSANILRDLAESMGSDMKAAYVSLYVKSPNDPVLVSIYGGAAQSYGMLMGARAEGKAPEKFWEVKA